MQLVQAAPLAGRLPRLLGYLAAAALAAVVFVLAWFAGTTPWKSGQGVGYQFGLWGGISMLVLFTYPLRKRLPRVEWAGPVRHWFALHMALGISGPLLILLHTRFQLESLNATVSFWSMVLVAGSGIIGRFLYRRIHHGLFGRRTSLDELRAHAGFQEGEEARSWLKYLPEVRRELDAFGEEAERPVAGGLGQFAHYVRLELRGIAARRRARAVLRRELPIVARARAWDEATLARRIAKGDRLVGAWISRSTAIGRFAVYERLFALWHMVHLPFVVLLFASACVHVLYVHMY